MNHFTAEQQALLILLRKSLWGESVLFPTEINWETVADSAKEHAVVSIAYDGAVASHAEIPAELLHRWKTTLLRGILQNERLLKAQDELITWFSDAKIPAVVLKGSSIARYYPHSELRVLGDIDILVDESNLDAVDMILQSHGYTKHESDHDFHIGYARSGAYVEIHYHVTDLPDSTGGRATERVTAQFLNDIHHGAIAAHTFPVLSEPHQAVSLLLHMIRHMFTSGIGLRQLCDWAVYIDNADSAVFSEQTIPLLSQCGLLQYAKVATSTCIHYLGLPDKQLTWCADVENAVAQAFLSDIFRGGNMGDANKEAMGSLFTDNNAMGTNQSPAKALLVGLNQLAYRHFPFTQKYKLLLPFFWIYLPVRYLVRSLFGLRPRKSVSKVISSAKQRRDLYDKLDLFVIQTKGK